MRAALAEPAAGAQSPAPNLRLALRFGTRAAHDRVDAAAGALDLSQPDDRARFLRAHHCAYQTLRAADAEPSALIAHRLACAHADLLALGVPANAAALPCDAPALHGAAGALGVGYVLAGSHLGNRQLARTWPGEPPRLLVDPRLAAHWPELLTRLRAKPGGDARAQEVLAAARATFAVFEAAFRAV